MPQLKPFIKKSLSDIAKEYLLEYIRAVDKNDNAKLPSEVELSAHLNVSRVTIRRALSELESEGMILRIHGKGTFVNQQMLQINLNLNPAREFFQLIMDSGYQADVKLINCRTEQALERARRLLRMEQGELLVRLDKLFYANGNPCIYCIDYVPKRDLASLSGEQDYGRDTFQMMNDCAGKVCVRDTTELYSYSRAEMTEVSFGQDLMGCDSVLALDSVVYDQSNEPVFFCKAYYNTKYIKFNLIRNFWFHET